jgi:hypothetical protein
MIRMSTLRNGLLAVIFTLAAGAGLTGIIGGGALPAHSVSAQISPDGNGNPLPPLI